MKNVQVILWGLGAMGGGIGKMLAKKKGVDIVGAIDIGNKLGKNLYDVVPGIEQGDRADVIIGTPEELGWKPTTTYTVIKRLSERGIVKNEHSVVTSLVSKEDVQDDDMDDLIEKRFEGSVPAFLAAFTRREKLSDEEFRQLSDLIERFRKGDS